MLDVLVDAEFLIGLAPVWGFAEHRLRGRLRRAGLPFEVPEPVAAPDGRTVIETPAGAATLWRPRAVGLLGDAMRTVPLEDAPQDWRRDRVARWWPGAGGELPVQVVHGDPTASNALVLLDTGQVSALLDLEFVGVGFGVQDFVAALSNSGLLREQAWRRRTQAFLRGHASVRRLSAVEIQALPDLLISRSLDSAVWRAARWRRGQRTPLKRWLLAVELE